MINTVETRLEQALAGRTVKRVRDTGRRLSAVLLPLFRREGEYCMLFTKRTELVQDHKGQISFPGGTYEPEDGSLLRTALRECQEEIGLAPAEARILGRLDDTPTAVSNYIISPFVAVIPWPYDFLINPGEIEELIEVPLAALLNGDCTRQDFEIIDGIRTDTTVYVYRKRVIWGATARILTQFLDIYRLIV